VVILLPLPAEALPLTTIRNNALPNERYVIARRPFVQVAQIALLTLLATSCGGGGPGGPVAATPPPAAGSQTARAVATTSAADATVAWSYEVNVGAALDLDVRATLHGPFTGGLVVDRAATKFADAVELAEGDAWRKTELNDARWASACASTCTLRYHFRLRDAAKAIGDVDVAIAAGGAVFAPPSTWLVRPSDERAAGRYRFHVTTPARVRFATGIRVAAGAAAGTYEAPIASLGEAAFAAFGALRMSHLADPGIEAVIAPDIRLPDDVITRWLKSEVDAVTTYFAHPPDGHAMLFIAPGNSADTGGKTLGGGGASLLVRLGDSKLAARDLADDWVVAHELVHVASPDLDRRYTWFSEGLATYVEPIARERAGLVKREKVWTDMLEGLPQGLPGPGDGGLDGTQAWGRTYWGGAVFFFLADVRIRERTRNAKGLEDALRAVVATGGNVETMWTLARMLDVGDAATGTKVLHELYDELGGKRGEIDLEGTFRKLGVRLESGTVRFDDRAPLAAVRDAILPPGR
jgi:predicted metalloprotease with PDZ domain